MAFSMKKQRTHVDITSIEQVKRVTGEDGIAAWELQTREGPELMEEVRLRAEHFAEGTIITIRETRRDGL
jgi:hypothetical protein